MTIRDHSWRVRRAQALLARHGVQLAGVDITGFVVRLLDAGEQGMADAEAVEVGLADAECGALGLVQSEPLLGQVRLDPPVETVDAAAAAAIRTFGVQLLRSQRREPVVPSEPPTEAQRAAMRAAIEASVPRRIEAAEAQLASGVWSERVNAAMLLGRHRHRASEPALRRLLDDPYPQVRDEVQAALARMAEPDGA